MNEIDVVVPLKLTMDPNRVKNTLHMTYGDTCVEITDKKTKKELGYTISCLGGAIEVCVGKYTWTLLPKDLWMAVEHQVERFIKYEEKWGKKEAV